jgi:hypothetical protein
VTLPDMVTVARCEVYEGGERLRRLCRIGKGWGVGELGSWDVGRSAAVVSLAVPAGWEATDSLPHNDTSNFCCSQLLTQAHMLQHLLMAA